MARPMLMTMPMSTLAQVLRRTVMGVGVAAAAALWLATAAGATTLTPVQPNPGGEPSLATAGGLLNSLYGLSNLARIDDSLDQQWGNLGTAEVIAKAKYAGYSQTFGYITGASGGAFVPLFSITQSGLLTGISAQFTVAQSGESFRWGDDPNGTSQPPGLWSALQSDNAADGGQDHMVTWLITGAAGHPDNHVGAFVIAFEDLSGLGDRDYNDLVVEVRGVSDGAVPLPATLALVAAGLAGLGALRIRARRQS